MLYVIHKTSRMPEYVSYNRPTCEAAGAAQTVVDNAQVNDVAHEGMDVVKQFLIKEKERLMSHDEKKK